MPATMRATLEQQAAERGISVSAAAREAIEKQAEGNGRRGSFAEIGVSGLEVHSGHVYEEFHRDLTGDRAIQIYKEMVSNSPTVQGVLYAIDMLMRQVEWTVTPGGESSDDERAAELIETGITDMSTAWEDTLSEIFSMLPYGWAYHELVYKRRNGGNPLRPGLQSRYTDGMIGWRKMPIRSQDSRDRWEFGDDGSLAGMWQRATTQRRPVFIPIQKALLFRPRITKANPEGWSILRSAYRPYYFTKRLEEIEGIGVERDLAGLPVGKIPGEHIRNNTATYTAWKKAVRNVRRNEQEALVIPSDVDPDTKAPLYDLSLLTTGGRRQFDIGPIVDRYNKSIAMSMMADFIFLGQQAVGSYALASSKTTLFAMSLGAYLDQISSVFNRHAIPRLLALNGFRLETPPMLQHGDVETVDPQEIADAVSKFTGSGMPFWGGPDGLDLENWGRKFLGAPELQQEAYDEREAEREAEEKQRMEVDAARLAMMREQKQTPPVQAEPRESEEP